MYSKVNFKKLKEKVANTVAVIFSNKTVCDTTYKYRTSKFKEYIQ